MRHTDFKTNKFFLLTLCAVYFGMGFGSEAIGATDTTPRVRTVFSKPTGHDVKDETIKNEIVRLINATPAGASIRASFFSGGLSEVANALGDASDLGVDVKVVLDNNWDETQNGIDFASLLESRLGFTNVIKCTRSACLQSGNGSNNHNKFYSFSKTKNTNGDVINHVSVQTSANMNTSQLKVYQDMVVIQNDKVVYDHYFAYFADLAKQISIPNYQLTANGNATSTSQNIKVFSSGNLSGDPMLEVLKATNCTKGVSRIDMSQSMFTADRGDKFISELSRLKNQGCEVHILLPKDADDVPSINTARSLGLDLTVIDHEVDINVHSKILLIHANVGGAIGKKIVFMGSLNMVEESLKYNDDTFLQIGNDAVYQDYLSYIEHIRKNVLPGSATPLYVTYPQTSYRFFTGVPIQAQQPVISAGGLAARCTVTPALPAGLKLSASTCAISGTPSMASGKSSHSITVKSEYASHQEKTVVISFDISTSYVAPPKPCTNGFCQQLP